MTVRVGIIDSGVAGPVPIAAGRAFLDGEAAADVSDDRLGHGSAIASAILAAGGEVELLVARVFGERRVAPVARVVAALDWLVGAGADVINMSFGLRQPDASLRAACACAEAAGVLLVAAAAARGGPVFPAAYASCIAVAGDARCRGPAISWLGTPGIDFGADPLPAGASLAAARVSGRVARLLAAGVPAAAMRAALRGECRHVGPERRGADCRFLLAPAPRP